MIVRKAIPGDETTMGRIHVEGWQSSYREIYPVEYLDSLVIQDRVDMWAEFLKKNLEEKSIFVATDDDKILGFIGVRPYQPEQPSNDDGEISVLYVDPVLQGKGIGAALVKHVLNWYRVHNIKRVFVQTADKSKYKSFYAKQGATELPDKIRHEAPPGHNLDMAVFKWEL